MQESSHCFRRSCGTVPGLSHPMEVPTRQIVSRMCLRALLRISGIDILTRTPFNHIISAWTTFRRMQPDLPPHHLPAPGGCSKCTGRWSYVERWTSAFGCSIARARRPLSHRHKDMRRRRSGAFTLSALGRTTSTSTTATWPSWSHWVLTPREIMLGFTAKAGEPLAGARQFPTHGASPRHRMVNLSNVVGTQIPQAVGSALASKMRGEDTVTIVYFGDGASSVGDCHEAMKLRRRPQAAGHLSL